MCTRSSGISTWLVVWSDQRRVFSVWDFELSDHEKKKVLDLQSPRTVRTCHSEGTTRTRAGSNSSGRARLPRLWKIHLGFFHAGGSIGNGTFSRDVVLLSSCCVVVVVWSCVVCSWSGVFTCGCWFQSFGLVMFGAPGPAFPGPPSLRPTKISLVFFSPSLFSIFVKFLLSLSGCFLVEFCWCF